jgi:hypothetical protein
MELSAISDEGDTVTSNDIEQNTSVPTPARLFETNFDAACGEEENEKEIGENAKETETIGTPEVVEKTDVLKRNESAESEEEESPLRGSEDVTHSAHRDDELSGDDDADERDIETPRRDGGDDTECADRHTSDAARNFAKSSDLLNDQDRSDLANVEIQDRDDVHGNEGVLSNPIDNAFIPTIDGKTEREEKEEREEEFAELREDIHDRDAMHHHDGDEDVDDGVDESSFDLLKDSNIDVTLIAQSHSEKQILPRIFQNVQLNGKGNDGRSDDDEFSETDPNSDSFLLKEFTETNDNLSFLSHVSDISLIDPIDGGIQRSVFPNQEKDIDCKQEESAGEKAENDVKIDEDTIQKLIPGVDLGVTSLPVNDPNPFDDVVGEVEDEIDSFLKDDEEESSNHKAADLMRKERDDLVLVAISSPPVDMNVEVPADGEGESQNREEIRTEMRPKESERLDGDAVSDEGHSKEDSFSYFDQLYAAVIFDQSGGNRSRLPMEKLNVSELRNFVIFPFKGCTHISH